MEEGLMRRPKLEEDFIEETPEVEEKTEEKPKADYIPIRRLGDGRLAAYDKSLGGVVVFGSSEDKMSLREVDSPGKYKLRLGENSEFELVAQ